VFDLVLGLGMQAETDSHHAHDNHGNSTNGNSTNGTAATGCGRQQDTDRVETNR